MIDADRTTVRKTGLEQLYADALRRARSITSRLSHASRAGPIWACDASTYDSTRAFDRNAFLVGDAASFVEVVSSGGVKKALSSAWNAAVVINTCLTKPGMQSTASAYFDRRERRVHAEYVRRAAGFFSDAAAVYNNDFWTVRSRAAESIADDGGPSDFDLSRDVDVRDTFGQLRDVSQLDLVTSPQTTFEDVAVIEGREVVLREGIVIPGIGVPVRFLAGLNLPELVRMAPDCRDLPSLLAAYTGQVAPVDPRDLLVALSFVVTRGVLKRGLRSPCRPIGPG